MSNQFDIIKRTDFYAIKNVLRILPFSRSPLSKLRNVCRFLTSKRREWVSYGPLEYQIDITYRCNLNCNTCFLRKQNLQMNSQSDMSTTEINYILDKADKTAIAILLGGGEPLLYPDVGKVINMVVRRGFYCSLSTNGILLGKLGTDIIDAGAHSINVSIDGHDADTYNKVRNADRRTWDVLIDSIQTFRSLLDKKRKNFFQFRCNFTLTRQTVHYLKEMISFATKLRFDVIYFNNINSFSGEDLTLYSNDLEVREILNDVIQTCQPDAYVYLPILVDRSRRGFCRDPFVLTVIKKSGLQGRCCFDLPVTENGNFFGDREPFNTERYQALRRIFLHEDTLLPDECDHCYRRFEHAGIESKKVYYNPFRRRWIFV